MEWLYRLATGAYHAGIGLSAKLGKEKARKWVAGRKDQSIPGGGPFIWLHAASLGEYEQGRPVLQQLREQLPDHRTVVTFFSPSGYERCREDPLIDHIRYLPKDGALHAGAWVSGLRPAVAIFVKYEFWFYHLSALRSAKVPTVLIAGSFRQDQLFFRSYGKWYRRMLELFDLLIVQTRRDADLLTENGISDQRIEVGGDPRIDRVHELASAPFSDPVLEAFPRDKPIILAGSVWPDDAELLLGAWPVLRDHYRIVLAPHELDKDFLVEWEQRFPSVRYTDPSGIENAEVLILNTIGILSRSYRYATVAYVGGGIRTGLHNTLEPLAYGLPVVFGPRYEKFPEAGEAIRRGGAFSVGSSHEVQEVFTRLLQSSAIEAARSAQGDYLKDNLGSARRTASMVLKLITLWLLLLPTCVFAQDPPVNADRVLDESFEKGNLMSAISSVSWRDGLSLAVGTLEAGKSISLNVSLRANTEYGFIGSGTSAVSDLDLRLFSREGNLIAADTSSDDTPVVNFRSTYTGIYTLQLHYVNGMEPIASVGLSLLGMGGSSLVGIQFSRQRKDFFASARRFSENTGAELLSIPGQWSVFGVLVPETSRTLSGIRLPAGQYYIAANGGTPLRELSLYLANEDQQIIKQERASGPFPRLELVSDGTTTHELLLSAERSRGKGLVLLGVFQQ